jgi:Fe-S cluster assembly protein SufB
MQRMTAKEDLNMDYSKYDFKDSTELYVFLSKKGLSRGTVASQTG